jgi:hypothetical protein
LWRYLKAVRTHAQNDDPEILKQIDALRQLTALVKERESESKKEDGVDGLPAKSLKSPKSPEHDFTEPSLDEKG